MDGSERYFPNHRIERDIGLAEYELAATRLSAEETALNWAKTVSLAISSIIVFISFKAAEYSKGIEEVGLSHSQAKFGSLIVSFAVGLLATIHISNLMKSKHIAERKIIVLRRMLGLRYGENTLVLPNWRLEGADSPFAIHLFPGYLSPKSFPVHLIAISMVLGAFLLGDSAIDFIPDHLAPAMTKNFNLQKLIALAMCATTLFAYRYHLREMHENTRLTLARLLARVLAIRIVQNIENSIYHVKLDIEEAKRVNADFSQIKTLAVCIEDADYYQHNGISWRGIARAVKGRVTGRNLGGGSTITQQFARGNFIRDLSPAYRRKIVEISLSFWVESVFNKDEILLGYLTTARFESGVYGFHRASKHFLSTDASEIGLSQSFFLIERLGNVNGYFLGRRIFQLLKRLLAQGVLDHQDVQRVLDTYQHTISRGLIKVKAGDLDLDQVREKLSK